MYLNVLFFFVNLNLFWCVPYYRWNRRVSIYKDKKMIYILGMNDKYIMGANIRKMMIGIQPFSHMYPKAAKQHSLYCFHSLKWNCWFRVYLLQTQWLKFTFPSTRKKMKQAHRILYFRRKNANDVYYMNIFLISVKVSIQDYRCEWLFSTRV